MRSDHWRNEADFLPESLEDLADLRRRVMDAGHSAPVANGLLGWLVSKAAGEDDVTNSVTRSKYRKILAELPPPEGPVGGPARLEVVGSDGSKTRRRRIPGARSAMSAVVALALLVGGAGHRDPSQARTEASGGSPAATGAGGEPPRIHGRSRSVKSGRRLRKAA
jgi:hypothetical protein